MCYISICAKAKCVIKGPAHENLVRLFACWVILHAFCHLLICFFIVDFFEKKNSEIASVSYSFEPDQAQYVVGPELDPNYL